MKTGNFRGFEVEVHEPGIAWIRFNEPERLNGMTQPLKRDLVETLLQAQLDNAVRVVVLTGSGRAFSAGDDLSGGYKRRASEEREALVPDIPPGHDTAIGTYDGLRALWRSVRPDCSSWTAKLWKPCASSVPRSRFESSAV